MKQLVLGILAHVDAGKTTLSEALLYRTGAIRDLGRVDHKNAHMDTHALERARGITIFSRQARMTLGDTAVTLLDTPGHVDFSAEMERTLQVLDYAVLVISGTDGVQAHTQTLWQLLRRYRVPVFVFVTKMDLPGAERAALMDDLRAHLSGACVDFTDPDPEQIALCDEAALEQYLDTGALPEETVRALIRGRKLFPCLFGSGLKLTGVDELLAALARYAAPPDYPAQFGARVYKIMRDAQGNRLTCLKVTGGQLRVRTPLTYLPRGADTPAQEKVNAIRLYSGEKFETAETVSAGGVCAVQGLTQLLNRLAAGIRARSLEMRQPGRIDDHAHGEGVGCIGEVEIRADRVHRQRIDDRQHDAAVLLRQRAPVREHARIQPVAEARGDAGLRSGRRCTGVIVADVVAGVELRAQRADGRRDHGQGKRAPEQRERRVHGRVRRDRVHVQAPAPPRAPVVVRAVAGRLRAGTGHRVAAAETVALRADLAFRADALTRVPQNFVVIHGNSSVFLFALPPS